MRQAQGGHNQQEQASMEAVVAKDSPTVPARRLARELKRLREASGTTQAKAAEYVGTAATTISKIENAERGVPLPYLKHMIRCYKVGKSHAETLLKLAEEARQPAWFAPYREILPRWFTGYISLETAAPELDTYEVELVPGLLQTTRYTEALTVVLGLGGPTNNADGYLAVRARRQQRLADNSLTLRAVLNEAAVRRAVGGSDVMREQLAWLQEVAQRPNVSVRVLPFNAGAHPAMAGSFSVLHFSEHEMDTVYVEFSGDAAYWEKPPEVERHADIFRRLTGLALDEGATAEFLGDLERRC